MATRPNGSLISTNLVSSVSTRASLYFMRRLDTGLVMHSLYQSANCSCICEQRYETSTVLRSVGPLVGTIFSNGAQQLRQACTVKNSCFTLLATSRLVIKDLSLCFVLVDVSSPVFVVLVFFACAQGRDGHRGIWSNSCRVWPLLHLRPTKETPEASSSRLMSSCDQLVNHRVETKSMGYEEMHEDKSHASNIQCERGSPTHARGVRNQVD